MSSFHTADATRPASRAVPITPSSSEIPVTRGVYVGTAGSLTVILADDVNEIEFVNVANGTLLPIQARVITATGTASDIIALY